MHGVRSVCVRRCDGSLVQQCNVDVKSKRYSDSQRVGRPGDRISVGERFPAPVQTGHEAHQASYTLVTVFLSGVKRPGRGVKHASPSSAEIKERVELNLHFPSGPSWPVLGWTLPAVMSVSLTRTGCKATNNYVNAICITQTFAYGAEDYEISATGVKTWRPSSSICSIIFITPFCITPERTRKQLSR